MNEQDKAVANVIGEVINAALGPVTIGLGSGEYAIGSGRYANEPATHILTFEKLADSLPVGHILDENESKKTDIVAIIEISNLKALEVLESSIARIRSNMTTQDPS